MFHDRDLNAFAEEKLKGSRSEAYVNDASIKFVKTKSYQSAEISADYAGRLICLLYNWGYYPTELISFCATYKIKAVFEDLKDPALTEELVDVLVKLIEDRPASLANRMYLKLIGLQKIQNIHNNDLIARTIQICLGCLGRFVTIDKLVYIILIKFALKISEGIKEYKSQIAEKIISLIFAMFSQFSISQFCEIHEFMKIYLYYLKLLVTLGKEIAIHCERNQEDDPDSFEETRETMSLFSKILILNLQLSPLSASGSKPRANSLLSSKNELYQKVVSNISFKNVIAFHKSSKYSDYNNLNYSHFCDGEFEGNLYLKDYQTESEVFEKVKVNSMKLLMVLIRHSPESFINDGMSSYLFPSTFDSFLPKSLFTSACFIPQSLYCEEPVDLFGDGRIVADNMMLQIIHTKVDNHREEAPKFLQQSKQLLIKKFCSSPADSSTLVSALLNESKYEIKSILIETLSVLVDVITKKGQSRLVQDWTEKKKERLAAVMKENSVKILTIFMLELYSCKPAFLKHVLTGMAHCPSETMLIHTPNKLVNNIIDHFICPIFEESFLREFDFLVEFDKFLIAIFDAGFSEYFLSKIEYIKEIIAKTFQLHQNHSRGDPADVPKLKIFCTLIDHLINGHPKEMVSFLPFLTEYYLGSVFPVAKYSSLHAFVPNLLCKIVQIKNELTVDQDERKLIRSLSVDLDLEKQIGSHELSSVRSDEELSPRKSCLKKTYFKLTLLTKALYTNLIYHSAQSTYKDGYENSLVTALVSVEKHQLPILSQELFKRFRVNLETCLIQILAQTKNKKCQLSLIDYFLSSSEIEMPGLRNKMWSNLFRMYKDKVLSVEIVFTNYNIIYGLRDFQQIINERWIVEIFYQTVSSMKSKNRKLINNCLKIFAYILGYYSFSILTWILEMDVPNVFYDEMEGGNRQQETVSTLAFLEIAFRKFLTHKYSKFNIITLSSIQLILRKHEYQDHDISRALNKFALSFNKLVSDRLVETDCYKFIHMGICLLSREQTVQAFEYERILKLTKFCVKIIEQKECEAEIGSAEQTSWKELQQKILDFFLIIERKSSTFVQVPQRTALYSEMFKGLRPLLERLKEKVDDMSRDQAGEEPSQRQSKSNTAVITLVSITAVEPSISMDDSAEKMVPRLDMFRAYSSTLRRLKKFAEELSEESESRITLNDMTLLSKLYSQSKHIYLYAESSTKIIKAD